MYEPIKRTIGTIAGEPLSAVEAAAEEAYDQLLLSVISRIATTLDEHDEPPYLARTIGTIAGELVTACYTDEGELFAASITLNGLKISTDGDSYLNFDVGEGLAAVGDMHLWEWGRIKELAQTDIVEQLITLARKEAAWSRESE